MFSLTFVFSKSKKYSEALRFAMDLGAIVEGEKVILNLEKTELLFAYRLLFPLVKIISKWKGARATYNGKEVHPYRFIFELWNNVASCAADMNSRGNHGHCNNSPTEAGWGCKFIRNISRDFYGSGNYEKGHPFWYNYGWFEKNGDWMIDKGAIWTRIKNEVTSKGLDACPFFNLQKVKDEVFNQLPNKIIIDHVTFRAHFDVRYEAGERKIIPVNIRHISDPKESYREREKKLINGLSRSMFYGVNEIEMPPGIVDKNRRLSDKLEVLKSTDMVVKAFSEGVCKN